VAEHEPCFSPVDQERLLAVARQGQMVFLNGVLDGRVERWSLSGEPFSADLDLARALVESVPDMALAKCRQLLEGQLHLLHEARLGPAGTRSLDQLIRDLARADVLPRKVLALCEVVRELGNAGAHPIYDDEKLTHAEAHIALQSLTIILEWYVRTQKPAQP
jgi:hypothetical protein